MSILIEINNGQPIPLMWYIFILLFFRILALENIAKILTTGPRLYTHGKATKRKPQKVFFRLHGSSVWSGPS